MKLRTIILAMLMALLFTVTGCGDSSSDYIQVTVTRVVDGDTIHVNMNGQDETVRLIGVDTPETVKPNSPVEPYGREASAFTKSRLTGKTVYLEMDVEERDKYKRLLAYVWLEPPSEVNNAEIQSKMFNAKLLLDGYGQLLTIPPNVKYSDYFTQYQKEARENNRGLWGDISKETEQNDVSAAEAAYIGNKNTHKFHVPNCRSVGEMNEENMVYFKLKEEAINGNYQPCGICKP